jgi:hypothetical protein
METVAQTAKARCTHCRVEVEVTAQYAHGDHIKCGTCSTKHKVVRGEVLRLVLADPTPLRDTLRSTEQMIDRLEAERRGVSASVGIGANGFGIGVLWVVYKVALGGEPLSVSLFVTALVIGLLSGIALEGANWLFLAKRHRITKLTEEIEEARSEGAKLRQQIRDATRI